MSTVQKMRIPSDQFDTVDVSEVSYGEKLEQSNQQQSSPATNSLFSGFQLKLTQFRMRSPNGTTSSSTNAEGESESTPTSPVFSRRGSERGRKNGTSLAPPQQRFFQHATLSRHQSLSANNTPVKWDFSFLSNLLLLPLCHTTTLSFVRKPLSAQVSVGQQQQRNDINRKSSSGSEYYVCRDCQTLIENIIYHPVHTVHCDRPSIHVSLP